MKVYVVWPSDDDMSDLRKCWGILLDRDEASSFINSFINYYEEGYKEYVIKEYELIEIKKEED